MTTKERRLLVLVVIEALAILAIVWALVSRERAVTASSNFPSAGVGHPVVPPEAGVLPSGESARERGRLSPTRPDLAPPARHEPLRTATPALRLLAGLVTDPAGTPLAGVRLRFSGAPEDRGRRVRSDEEGRYVLTGISSGRWSVQGSKAGFRPLSETIDVGDEPLHPRRDFVLDPAVVLELRFRTPDGQSINAALAAIESDDNRSAAITAVATAEKLKGHLPGTARSSYIRFGCGSWSELRYQTATDAEALRARGVDGLLQVNGDLPVWVSAVLRHRVLASQRVDPGEGEVTFTIAMEEVTKHLASARLRVVAAEDGKPLAKVRVFLTDRQSVESGKLCDASGVVTFERMRPGILLLQLEGQGRERALCHVRLEPGIMNDLGTFELAEATSISGTVVDPEGAPCLATLKWVSLERTATLIQRLDMPGGVGTRADGSFEIPWLGRGRYLLTAFEKDFALCTAVVPTWGGSVEGVRMELQRAPVSVLDVRVPAGRVWLLRLLDENGVPRWARDALSARPIPLRLPPGSYTLEVYDEGELIRSLSLAVKGEALEVVVEP